MTTEQEFKYEVAFSFLKQDETIAFDLNDRILDRLSTFVYSKRQEELGGTDGEKIFSSVFYEQSRIVVVLYREGWGQTSWTRIEEYAIKNRAFEYGWDFLVFINLDINSKLPTWIPRTYIWVDYQRFKSEGAIAIIEQKCKEAGGQSRPESVEDKANRLKRLRIAEKERELFLDSPDGLEAVCDEVHSIILRLKEIKLQIEDPSTNLHLSREERTDQMYSFGHNGYNLRIEWNGPHIQKVSHALMRISLYEASGHHRINYRENIIKQCDYKFDRDLIGNNGWLVAESGKNFQSSNQLIETWATRFIDDIGKRRTNAHG